MYWVIFDGIEREQRIAAEKFSLERFERMLRWYHSKEGRKFCLLEGVDPPIVYARIYNDGTCSSTALTARIYQEFKETGGVKQLENVKWKELVEIF